MKVTAARSDDKSSVRMNSFDITNSWPVGKVAIGDAEVCRDVAKGNAEIRQMDERGDLTTRDKASTRQIETIVVDQNGLFREGLKRLLAETAYYPAVAAASLDEVRLSLEAKDDALLLILDSVSNPVEACEQVRALKEYNPSIRVVMLVERYDLKQMLTIFEAGAAACLMKSTSHEALVKVLDLVMLDETVFLATILTQLRGPAAFARNNGRTLSAREIAVLECLAEGASNKVIARMLDISEATVKVHVKAILRKLKAKNRTQAAIWASTHIVTTSQ
ncbi:LuxR C-terminal-related transcriptional regulator [Microvirga calopogonii]|uniref:LuxR C-terminal-related transcriptional regulator n=1 Tax=Microvirga calopogonii TaxID=2078013 RepID=UPI000E0D0B1A|nr:response regulator transcription factor [Microvirga calopogonii]